MQGALMFSNERYWKRNFIVIHAVKPLINSSFLQEQQISSFKLNYLFSQTLKVIRNLIYSHLYGKPKQLKCRSTIL